MSNHEKEGLILSPKVSFALGLVGGAMLLCTVGFFILLAIVLGDNSSDLTSPSDTVEAADTVPVDAVPEETVGPVEEISDADHVWGSSKADVDIIVYSDLECPYCGRFHETIKQIQDQYEDQVRIAFRHFPLSFHPNAMPAALATECAGEQGKFWEFLDQAFANQASLGDELYAEIASDIKLNKSKFEDCLADNDFTTKINADRSSGSAAGISGTPGSIILGKNGSIQLVPGALPFEQVKPMIDAALLK